MSTLGVLKQLRPYVRRCIDIKREYRLRRLLYQAFPTPAIDARCHLLHCCAWKTASQWVRLILSDPRLYRHIGRLPYVGTDLPHPEVLARGGRLLTSLYWKYDQFETFRAQTGAAKSIFVVRDPRDLLVSWYYSNRFSHDPTPIVLERRARMVGLNEENGIRAAIEDFGEIDVILQSWARRGACDEDVLIIKFEDLTGCQSAHTWMSIFDHFGLNVPPVKVQRLLDFYDFSKLKGRTIGSKAPGKYRSGRPGEWRDTLSDGNVAYFKQRFGYLIQAFGYPSS